MGHKFPAQCGVQQLLGRLTNENVTRNARHSQKWPDSEAMGHCGASGTVLFTVGMPGAEIQRKRK